MGEHDDDLEVIPSQEAPSPVDVTRVAEAIADGLRRIATVLENGMHEIAQAIVSADGVVDRKKPKARQNRRH